MEMRKLFLCSALALAGGVLAGCNNQSVQTGESAATNAWEETKQAGSNVWHATEDAFAIGTYTNETSTNYFSYDYSMKEAFISDARMSLSNLDQSALRLSNRVANASENTKADLQQTLDGIKNKRGELDRRYDALKNSSQNDWNDAKAEFVKSYHDLKADLKAGWDTVTSKM